MLARQARFPQPPALRPTAERIGLRPSRDRPTAGSSAAWPRRAAIAPACLHGGPAPLHGCPADISCTFYSPPGEGSGTADMPPSRPRRAGLAGLIPSRRSAYAPAGLALLAGSAQRSPSEGAGFPSTSLPFDREIMGFRKTLARPVRRLVRGFTEIRKAAEQHLAHARNAAGALRARSSSANHARGASAEFRARPPVSPGRSACGTRNGKVIRATRLKTLERPI